MGYISGSLSVNGVAPSGCHVGLCEDGIGALPVSGTVTDMDAMGEGNLSDDWHSFVAVDYQLLLEWDSSI